MELSKAPRLTPFTAWGGSCVGASVLAGSKGAAGGGGGGGGGNADIPMEERARSQYQLQTPCTQATAGSWVHQTLRRLQMFSLRGTKITQYCMLVCLFFQTPNKKARGIKGEFIKGCCFSQ